MNGPSYRLPPDVQKRFGQRIDRAQPIGFRFNNTRLIGLKGDTLASALLANGISNVGYSNVFGRPRGIMSVCANNADPTVTLGADERHVPYARLHNLRLSEGLDAKSPSPLLSRLRAWTAGTGMGELFAAKPAFNNLADPASYEHVHVHVDALVIGAGLAGIAAAQVLAAENLNVMVADEAVQAGGIADAYDGTIDSVPLKEWLGNAVQQLAGMPNVDLRLRSCAVQLTADRQTLVVERVTGDHIEHAAMKAPRERLWHIKADTVVLATGAQEKPLVFQNNDRPGIMLGCSARLALRRYGVAAGKRVVVVTGSDEGHRTALDLKAAGVTIERLVDLRLKPDGALVHMAKAEALPLSFGSVPVNAATIRNGRVLEGITIANRLRMDGPALTREILCDAVIMSGGWQPNYQLAVQAGAQLGFDPDSGHARVRGGYENGVFIAGAANAEFDAAAVLKDGWKAGAHAAAFVLGRIPAAHSSAMDIEVPEDTPAEPLGEIAEGQPTDHAFIDLALDATAEQWLLNRQKTGGGADPARFELIKAKNLEKSFVVPVSMGTLAGNLPAQLFGKASPIARPETADIRLLNGWDAVHCYRRPGENRNDSVLSEAKSIVSGKTILDGCWMQIASVQGKEAELFVRALMSNTPMALDAGAVPLSLADGAMPSTCFRDGANRYVICAEGDTSLSQWLMEARERSGADAVVLDESERWAKIILPGEHAPNLPGIEPLAHLTFGAFVLLIPSGEAEGVWEKLVQEGFEPVGTGAFQLCQLATGQLPASHPAFARWHRAPIKGLVPDGTGFIPPAGTHLFHGKKPENTQSSPVKPRYAGIVLACFPSPWSGEPLALAAVHADDIAHVHCKIQGDMWQGRVMPRNHGLSGIGK